MARPKDLHLLFRRSRCGSFAALRTTGVEGDDGTFAIRRTTAGAAEAAAAVVSRAKPFGTSGVEWSCG